MSWKFWERSQKQEPIWHNRKYTDKGVVYDCWDIPVEEGVPDEVLDDLGRRLEMQVYVGHICICSGCGRVLARVLDSQTVDFPSPYTLWLESDGITITMICEGCGASTELAQ